MRKFKSHKIVEAEAIASIWDGGRRVTLADGKDIFVPPDVFARGHPSPDDYLIRYEDGYISWSPKATFEAGYDEMKGV